MKITRHNRKWFMAAGLVVTAGLLSACGSSGSSGGTEPKANSSLANAPGFKNLSGSVLYYDTSGGQFETLMNKVAFQPFAKLTGVSVGMDFHADMTQFWAGLQAGKVPWSILMFDGSASMAKSYNDHMLQPLDLKVVPTNLESGSGYDRKYLINFGDYAMAVTWNTKKWPLSGPHPETMADFYNTAKFPGKRCLYKSPQAGGTLESAVEAAGVAPKDIYPINLDLAFKQLDKIRSDTVWYTSGADSIRFLVSGECDMAVTWTPQTYLAVHTNGAPLAVSWKGAIYAPQYLAIPKNAPNPKAANALLAFLIRDRHIAQQLAMQNGIALPLVPPLKLPASLKPLLVTPENLADATPENGQYYASHLDTVTNAFNAWLQKS